jgi:hypothetical protein
MEFPELTLPDERLGCALGDSWSRDEDQRDNGDDDSGNADGEDEE